MACASLRPQIPILAPRLTFSGGGGGGGGRGSDRRSRKLIMSSSRCGEQYEYEYRSVRSGSGLNSPLEPKSPAGRSLCRVLLDEPRSFEDAVDEVLDRLVEDRDGAIARMKKSLGSDDAALHRYLYGRIPCALTYPEKMRARLQTSGKKQRKAIALSFEQLCSRMVW